MRIAESSKDETKRLRNRRYARQAYDSLEHYCPAANLDTAQLLPIREKMVALRKKLMLLGEKF